MKHFITLTEWTSKELWYLIDLAKHLKFEWVSGGNKPVLAGKILAMVFQKPSLRTRMSFEIAMKQLGGDAIYTSPEEVGLGKRESVADVARVQRSGCGPCTIVLCAGHHGAGLRPQSCD